MSLLLSNNKIKRASHSNSLKPNYSLPKPNEKKKFGKENSYFLIKNTEPFSKTKSKLMNFLVDQEARFIDLNKAEEFYNKQILENNRIINIKKNEIEKKKKILNNLSQKVNENLIKNFINNQNDLIEKMENEKKKLKIQIETFKQSFETYKDMKSELIDENIKLKNDLTKETNEEINRKTFYNKYSIINNKIITDENSQEKLFKTMTEFELKSKNLFDKKELKKRKKLAKEEFELNQLKQSMIVTEKYLNRLKNRVKEKKNLIPWEFKKNQKIFEENREIKKNNLKNILKINIIKKSLKLKDLNEVVKHLKNDQIKFDSRYNKINNLLKNLTKLRNETTEKNYDLKNIEKEIKKKLQKSNFLFFDQPEILDLIIKLADAQILNEIANEKSNEIEDKIKKITRFFELYNNKINNMLKSILIFNLKINEKNTNKNELEQIFLNFDDFQCLNSNLNKNKLNISFYTKINHFNKNDLIYIFKILINYLRKFSLIYNNFVLDICIHYEEIENKKESNKKKLKISHEFSNEIEEKNDENKLKIINIKNLTAEIEEKEKRKKLKKIKEDSKSKIVLDKNLIKEAQIKENISNELKTIGAITIQELLQKYFDHLKDLNEKKKKKQEKNIDLYNHYKGDLTKAELDEIDKEIEEDEKKFNEELELFKRLRLKYFNDFTKYTSKLVTIPQKQKNIPTFKQKKRGKALVINAIGAFTKANAYVEKIKETIELKNKEKKEKEKNEKYEKETNQILDDTFSDEENYNKGTLNLNEKKDEIDNNNFFNKNLTENELNNKRMFDLHKLNLALFHQKANVETKNDFEIIQNQFNNKLNLKIYSPIVKFFMPNVFKTFSNLKKKPSNNFQFNSNDNIKEEKPKTKREKYSNRPKSKIIHDYKNNEFKYPKIENKKIKEKI